jgi:hypothetical protein
VTASTPEGRNGPQATVSTCPKWRGGDRINQFLDSGYVNARKE